MALTAGVAGGGAARRDGVVVLTAGVAGGGAARRAHAGVSIV